MFDPLSIWEILLRAGVALVLGACIGWDREKKNKAAGLRTMAIVSLGACGMMIAASEVVAATAREGVTGYDPLRVVSGIVGGIGFLGAGSIIQSRGTVHGMTTAATIWAAATIGLASGLGLYRLAGVLCGLVLVVLVVMASLKGTLLPEHERDGEGVDQADA